MKFRRTSVDAAFETLSTTRRVCALVAFVTSRPNVSILFEPSSCNFGSRSLRTRGSSLFLRARFDIGDIAGAVRFLETLTCGEDVGSASGDPVSRATATRLTFVFNVAATFTLLSILLSSLVRLTAFCLCVSLACAHVAGEPFGSAKGNRDARAKARAYASDRLMDSTVLLCFVFRAP